MMKMRPMMKFALVVGGYVIACIVAWGVVYIWELFTQNAVAQASSGMYAFGDLLLFIVVFSLLALLPTGLALYFLAGKFLRR